MDHTYSDQARAIKNKLDEAYQKLQQLRERAPSLADDFEGWARWQYETERPAAQEVTELYQALGIQLYYDNGWPEGTEENMLLRPKH